MILTDKAPCPNCKAPMPMPSYEVGFAACQCGAVLEPRLAEGGRLAGWLIVSYRLNPETWRKEGKKGGWQPG